MAEAQEIGPKRLYLGETPDVLSRCPEVRSGATFADQLDAVRREAPDRRLGAILERLDFSARRGPNSLALRGLTCYILLMANLYKGKMEELRQAWGGRCSICGGTHRLQFAHLRPTGLKGRSRGQANRYHDIKNHAADYVLLCRACHYTFDNEGN